MKQTDHIDNKLSSSPVAASGKPAGQGSTVPGFSRKFQELLDLAGFPPMGEGRINIAEKQLNVHKSTVRLWCQNDTPPRTWAELSRVVKMLLEMAGRLDVQSDAVIGWLYQGNTPGTPFVAEEGTVDPLSMELYVIIRILSDKKSIDFNALSKKSQDSILSLARKMAENIMSLGAPLPSLGCNLDLANYISSLLDITGD